MFMIWPHTPPMGPRFADNDHRHSIHAPGLHSKHQPNKTQKLVSQESQELHSTLSPTTMGDLAVHQPLLQPNGVEFELKSSTPFLVSLTKWVLKSLMWVIFTIWVAVIFFYPTEFVRTLLRNWINMTNGSVYGTTGSIFLGFSAPILIIAILGFFYVAVSSKDRSEMRTSKSPRFRLWTFPVLVDGPFGVVSAAEMIGILLFSVFVVWLIIAYTIQNYKLISELQLLPREKSYLMIEFTGLRFGAIGLFCLIFLFLPVSRGSILLRLIDIPFEHATRYHIWLGHLTMAIFTLHGLFYMISWALQGKLIQELLEWKNIGFANLPGVIALGAGLLMWVTSLQPVRKNYFELFFYTHQLYVVFIVFLAMHVGNFIFSIAAGAIFLFVLDRFLRFCQSRNTVDIISAACRPCGTIELILSKPSNLHYNALSFIFLQVRELSWLQWHPFSVSSSPSDGHHHLSVLIKVLGGWTEKLRDIISNVPEHSLKGLAVHPYKITASVEGPYGHESPYHLTYENLILVAGGIGISPFLAIMSDILHRIGEGKSYSPKNVLFVWAVKKSKELSLLSVVDAQSICPSFAEKIHLDIQAYVTQESEAPLEEGDLHKSTITSSFSVINGCSMSHLVGTGNNMWLGMYVAVTTIGFVIFYGMVEAFYIKRSGVTSWWYQGLIFTLCMVATVVILGGIVISLWDKWEKQNQSYENLMMDNEKNNAGKNNDPVIHCETGKANLESVQTVHYGSRPDFKEIFNSFKERIGPVNVGVIVCGPPGLQSSVARECRSQNIKSGWNQSAVFHFNSHSFDL